MNPGGFQPLPPCVQVINLVGDVSFGRLQALSVFNTHVNLLVGERQPETTAWFECLWLFNFLKPQYIAVKRPCLFDLMRRDGDLCMMDS